MVELMPTNPCAELVLPWQIVPLDLLDAAQANDWLELLDHYAQDPMGGGSGLSAYAQANLLHQLQDLPNFHSAMALIGDRAVGLINCFTGFSTFAAKPLLNIHDIVVHAEFRGQGIAQTLLQWAAEKGLVLGCCKLTLEVLSNNQRAMLAYERAGFVPYALDPGAGQAVLLQKVF
jgi:ribosomal protein S18 acetylase RimI-like enzyme